MREGNTAAGRVVMQILLAHIMRFLRQEEGAVAAEYVLLVTLIAMVVLAAVTALGQAVIVPFTNAVNGFS